MVNWTVDGVNQLFQQWFWYRIGSTGPEYALNTLPLLGAKLSDANFNPGNDTLVMKYADATNHFEATITYSLNGGLLGSHQSDVGEQIQIHNTSSTTPLDLHFFQYSDFDLSNTLNDDTVNVLSNNVVRQTDPTVTVEETVVTPPATHHAVGLFPSVFNLLNDASPTTLDDSNGPLTGDVSYALEWDTTVAPNGSYLISKDKNITSIVPEPATLALLAASTLFLFPRRRRH
jgi:hypothetical protein